MIDKLKRLDQLVAMIDDENLKEEITDILFEVIVYYCEDKLKADLACWMLERGLDLWTEEKN